MTTAAETTSWPAEADNPDDLITLAEAARVIGIHENTALKLAHSGDLPGLLNPPRLGKKWCISRRLILLWKTTPLTVDTRDHA
ncbi:helix-turn-helix domain-containing protein [Desertimonas flava]|uniref:helix-turn-helix domain-containing protein n=1 Tax=Desertimonas flava TaxID=2064846 RepID=UPI000E34EC1C|nr:helix-turn-helix domain-containing protein [Desertimonas flava]